MHKTDISKAISFTKHPARIAIAIGKDSKNKYNLITLEWFMRTSIKPPMLAISIGHTRYSYECFQHFRFFNLCFPSKEMAKETLMFGTKSGRDIDKLEVSGLDWFQGKLVKLPIIKNAAANFECEIISQVRSGDHTIYAGKIKHAWMNDEKELLVYKDLG